MAVGVGFDRFHSSSTLSTSSKLSLASRFSYAAQQKPFYTNQGSSGCFSSPSLLQLSLRGSAPSLVERTKSCIGSRVRIGKLTSVKKCRHPQRKSLLGVGLYCVLHACEGATILEHNRHVGSSCTAIRKDGEVPPGYFAGKGYDLRGSLSATNACIRRLGRKSTMIRRCEAKGGGASYNNTISTAESGPGEGDRYVGSGDNRGGEIPENGSDSGTSLIRNSILGEEGLQREAGYETGEESAIDVLKEILRVAQGDLDNCRRNSEKLEEKAQEIAERAIALKDEATDAENLKNAAISKVEGLARDEARVEGELLKLSAAKAVAEDKVKSAEVALAEALSKAKARDVTQAVDEMQNEFEKQELVKAKFELTTERTMKISVKPVEEKLSPDAELVTQKETMVEKSESILNGCNTEAPVVVASAILQETEDLEAARLLLSNSEAFIKRIEAELSCIQVEKAECQREVERLRAVSLKAKATAVTADENVASAMAEAEQAVALELEAAQRVGDAEFALQKAESFAADAVQHGATFAATEAEKLAQSVGKTVEEIEEELEQRSGEVVAEKASVEAIDDRKVQVPEGILAGADAGLEKDESFKSAAPLNEMGILSEKTLKESDTDSKRIEAEKKAETVKEQPVLKASTKRSSRFFSASYFSSEDGEEFSPGKAYADFASTVKSQLGKIVISVALLFAGGAYVNNRLEKPLLLPQPPAYSTSIEQVNASTKPIVREFKKLTKRVLDLVHKLPAQEVHEEEASLFDVLWLLLASVIFVPLFMKIPGGSPVLGYLVAGVLIGPHTIHIIQNVHGTKVIAEFGVVFLLFNIGLELSVERLSSMKKYVFGLGSTQVFATATVVGVFLNLVAKISGPAALIIASGLALSSTAVVLQVLQERGESTSRHGRATFSVLLFQDLAVVVLLILIPLLSAKGGVGLREIGAALGVAGIKAVVAIVGIIASGRLFLRPIYKQMADNHNAEIFAANTLLVVLGTSVLTARAGLSMALGAFLAGLLLAETEFALQVESDIAPYRGLLLGLFFMTVGMSIDPKLLVARFSDIIMALALLIVGKTVLVASVGRLFGLSTIAAVRTGLLLAPGGEFAFVAFGEALNQGILSSQLSSLLFLVVGLSMALTPWLAAGGQLIAARFEQQDVRSLLPQENETDDLQGHIIICGFGRVGQIIAQLLAERLIPFVALDVRSDRVSVGRQLDLPVYFGDAGSKEVLHKIGAERAAAAVITLDTPGANYRTVWALSKHFPGVKTFVRAHDVDHGINLEKAGATAVVPETLEPSLQLAAAVLAQAKVPAYEIASAIDEFRSRHLSELTELTETSGTSLGYGFSRVMSKPLIEALRVKTDEEGGVDERIDGNIVAVP